MFDREISITGKHADQIKFLVNNAKIYTRYIEVYINAAAVGLYYNKKENKDTSSDSTAKIFADTVIKESDNLTFIYRLVMLLDNQSNLNEEKRIDRAFKDDVVENNEDIMKKNMELFDQYVNGGIQMIYSHFFEGNTDIDDYINSAYTFIKEFKNQSDDMVKSQIDEIINH